MPDVIDAYCTPGQQRDTRLPVASLLARMDAAGVARAVIAPEDHEIAVNCAEGNDRIARAAGESAGRLIAACAVNPWLGSRGVDLLRHSVAAGARMLVLAPALQGFILGDELSSELLDTAQSMNLPVYVHTGPHSSAAPSQLLLLAHRHPGVRFILGHGGSTDYSHDMTAILRNLPDNLWLETSFVRPWGLPAYAHITPAGRLIFGSSAPRNDLAFELTMCDRHWPIAQHPDAYGLNLLQLLDAVRPA